MRTVYKYAFQISDSFTLEMPQGAKILLVECQDNSPCIWVVCEPDAVKEQRTFVVTGTGHPIPRYVRHVASFQQPPFVWHLWEV